MSVDLILIVNAITLLVGVIVGICIGYYFHNTKQYNDIKHFANAYSDLSVQLINQLKNGVPSSPQHSDNEKMKNLLHEIMPQRREEEPDFSLLGGRLD